MDDIGDNIDIINILTPSGEHYKKVLELVRYGKPMVVEKPIALRLDEADQIIRECDRYGVRLFVVHQNRYNLPIIEARKSLELISAIYESVETGREVDLRFKPKRCRLGIK